jgi:hypothetical protein
MVYDIQTPQEFTRFKHLQCTQMLQYKNTRLTTDMYVNVDLSRYAHQYMHAHVQT